LLTSLACASLPQARRIVGRYTARWHIEASQLKQACRLESLIAVLSLIALRLLNTKLLATACPNQPLSPEQVGVEALQILANRLGTPKAG
jgi:hypothetical protein